MEAVKNADRPINPVLDLDDLTEIENMRGHEFMRESLLSLGGLTKREYFAGLAMQACRARNSEYLSWSDLASDSVEMADALLAELEKTK